MERLKMKLEIKNLDTMLLSQNQNNEENFKGRENEK